MAASPKILILHCKACGKPKIVEDPGTINEERCCYFCPDCSPSGREIWACRLCCRRDPCPYDVQRAIMRRTTEPLCLPGHIFVREKPNEEGGSYIMVLIGAKRFKIEVGRCPQGCHPAVRVELCEYLGREEFRRHAKDFLKFFMYVEGKRPWRWLRVFSTKEEATRFAMELARSLGEAAFLDENSRLCLVMPSRGE